MHDKMGPKVSVEIDADLQAKVSRYANGIGVEVSELVERALVYALTTLYPDNELPEEPFDPEIDNELPEGEIPVDPEYGQEENTGEIDNELPQKGIDPNLDPNLNPDLGAGKNRPVQELPPRAQPKK